MLTIEKFKSSFAVVILLEIRYHGVDSKSLSNLPLLYSWEEKKLTGIHIYFLILYTAPLYPQ